MLINLRKIYLTLLFLGISFLFAEQTKAALTCETDTMYWGLQCRSADLKSWNKGKASTAGCNVEAVCGTDPNGSFVNNCTSNTCVLSCNSSFTVCTGGTYGTFCKANIAPVSPCDEMNTCTNTCTSCISGYTLCDGICRATVAPTAPCAGYDTCNNYCTSCNSGYSYCPTAHTCVATQTCLPGQTFDSCSNSCVGSASMLKLGADSVSGTNVIQSANSSYTTLFIPQLNRVGIGTSTPSTFLQIFGGTGVSLNMSGGRISGLDLVPLASTDAVPLGYLQANYSSSSTSLWGGSLGGNIWNVNSGNVGIGTTTPSQLLTVGNNNQFTVSSSGTVSTKGNLTVAANSYGTIYIRDSGWPMLGVINADPLNGGVDTVRTGFYDTGGRGWGLFDTFSNAYKMMMKGGNLGIGTITPSEKLDVVGNIKFNGQAYSSKIVVNPTNGVGWYRIASPGGQGGGTVYLNAGIDNTNQKLEFSYNTRGWINSNSMVGTVTVIRSMNYNSGPISSIRIGSDGSGNSYLDLYVNRATTPIAFTVYGTNGASFLATPEYNPVTPAYIKTVDLGLTNYWGFHTTDGINVGGGANILGNMNIGTTTSSVKLKIDGGSGQTVNVSGGRIGGLDLVPLSADEAVPLGYLQSNYLPSSGSLWSGSLSGNVYNANSGNIGIGTTTPITKAHMIGTFTIDPKGITNSYSEGIRIGNATNGYSLVQFGANTGAATGSQANQWWIGKDGRDNGFNIWGNSTNDIFHILSNGNIGIGTITPTARLHSVINASGSDDANNAAIFQSTSGNGIVTIRSSATSSFAALYGSLGTDLVGAIDFRATSGDMSFWTNPIGSNSWTERMRILNTNGNVGIGTNNPGYKLEVSGTLGFTGSTANLGVDGATGMRVNNGYLYANGSGTSFYAQHGARFRGGISNDTGTYLTIGGGTSGYTYFSGSVGIGTTTPASRLVVIPAGGSTDDSINVGNAAIGGLDLTPIRSDQAVPLGYLQANYLDKNTSGVAKFIGYTAAKYDGNDAGSFTNANAYCNANYTGSHVCSIDEIFNTLNRGLASTITASSTAPEAWVNSGPPGYTANVNDCLGWTSNTAGTYGTVWYKATTTNDGYGSLGLCGTSYKYACCK